MAIVTNAAVMTKYRAIMSTSSITPSKDSVARRERPLSAAIPSTSRATAGPIGLDSGVNQLQAPANTKESATTPYPEGHGCTRCLATVQGCRNLPTSIGMWSNGQPSAEGGGPFSHARYSVTSHVGPTIGGHVGMRH